VNSDPLGSHPLVRNCKINLNFPQSQNKKNLIIGDSYARGIASEIRLNLDDDFEIQA
jgi:hypothetical protein